MIEVLTDLIQPRLMADIVDKGIAFGDLDYIIRTGLLMVCVALLGVLGGFGCTYFASITAQSFGTDLRSGLFNKVQSFSFANLDKFKTASLITRLTNDVVQVQTVVLMSMRVMVRAPLLCLGGIVMAMLIKPDLALILLVTAPVLAVALTWVIRRGFHLFSKVQRALDRVNTVMQENLSGVRVVKAFVRSDYEKERFAAANNSYMDISIQASRVVGLNVPVMILVLNLSILAVIWFGGIKVNGGSMLVGQIMAFINYMTQILFSLLIVGFMMMMLSRAKVSADRIREVLETEAEIQDREGAVADPVTVGRIDFEDVSFRYSGAGGDPVLRGISFTARPGETVAVLGATGSGKTTMVSLIPRFYEAAEGRVLVDGIDVRERSLAALRGGISMVLQTPQLFSGSVLDNIRWGRPEATEEEVRAAARAAQADAFITQLPRGYETVIGRRGVDLSGGQKQRIAIARALIRRPAILILDDSTSAVDVATEGLIQEEIQKLMAGTTRLVIAQRISTVLEADKILVLEDGRIAASGTHQELIASSPVYQDIYYSQLSREVVQE